MSASLAVALPPAGALLANKYRIVRVLGEGGMGVVYEAVHEALAQRVAIKVLRPEILEHAEIRVRFHREAKAAGQLKSRYSARVLDVDTTVEGLPFMVIELLEGHDLAAEIEKRGPLPVHEAVRYVIEACKAMAEAHDRGIVHRDLKPSNLFLADEHGERVVKVLDFGISRIEGDDVVRVTATKTTMGTPLYMSPEQVRSVKTVDARTDVWSLAVILYEALTGKAPFEGSAVAVGAAIVSAPPPSLRESRPDVPEALERLVLTGLEKDPDKRFPSVRAMIDALVPFAGVATFDSSPRLDVPAPPPSPRLVVVREKDRAVVAEAATIAAEAAPKRSPKVLFVGLGAAAVFVTSVVAIATVRRAPVTVEAPTAATPASPSASVSFTASPSISAASSAPLLSASSINTGAPIVESAGPVTSSRPPRPPAKPPTPGSTRNPVRL